MNQDDGYIINCPRCGAEMNSNSRYCMKCGNLNYNHEANKSMQPFASNVNTNTYEVGSGNLINNKNSSNKSVQTLIADNTGNKNICFGLNILAYLIILLINLFFSLGSRQYDLINNSYFFIRIVFLSIIFIYLYSYQLIFIKCNKPWWGIFIPIYNLIILSHIVFNKKWVGLLVLVPVIGQIVLLIMLYMLGKKFDYSGILTVLFPFIFIPLIAYGSNIYNGCVFVDNNSNNSLEKDYKLRKMFLTVCMFFLIVSSLLYLRININFISDIKEKINSYYFVYTSKKMVSKIKKEDISKFACSLYDYSNENGVYYIYYSEVSDLVYLPFYYQRESISGYIKIDNTTGESKYSISLSDGSYGFSETLIDDINVDTVIKYREIESLNSNLINVCR